MKKNTKKKTLTAVTGATVIGVAAAALVNGSKLESVFNPGKFEKFQNNYKSEDYDYATGDGEETDIAGDNQKDNEKNKGDDLQVLQLKKQESGDVKDNESFGIADNGETVDNTDSPETSDAGNNSIELSENQEPENTDPAAVPNGNGAPDNRNNGTSTAGTGGSGNSNGNGNGTGTATVTPTPGQSGNSTVTPTPVSTPAPVRTPTVTPAPTSSPEPTATPTPTAAPIPTSTPEPTSTPTPIPWEDSQLNPKDDVVTEDGTLVALRAEITKDSYALGETYQESDGTVTATFLQSDGTRIQKELSYGGADGYTVSLPTVKTGKQIAVFTYKGMSARAYYTVLKNSVFLNYMALYDQGEDGRIYSSTFPGTPMKNYKDGSIYTELEKYTQIPYNYATYEKYIDLSEVHKRYIALLGDSEIQKIFQNTTGESFANTVFLTEDAEGYLTNMLQGFRGKSANLLMDDRSYIFYSAANWPDDESRTVVDYITAVPEGYKIRREVFNEGVSGYSADQVLENYTGTDSVMTIPMGVTKISLIEKNESVKTLKIPQSVETLDITTLADNLPNLRDYAVDDGDTLQGNFRITDGMICSKDGKTLLSVPSGRKEVEIPETVTTLGENCLRGLSADAVVTFKSTTPPSLKGATGFRGTLCVPDSDGNTVYKNYMFRFGEACADLTFETAGGQKDLYKYSSNGPVLLYKDQENVLAGIPLNTRGNYTTEGSITAIGEDAFYGCNKLTDIILDENVTKLENRSLILSSHIDSVTIKNPNIIISDHAFGTLGTDEVNLNMKIYVPEDTYDIMLESWSSILDPVYGEGTAKSLLCTDSGTYVYEDGGKYLKTVSGDETSYQLIRVYQTGKTYFRIKDGTREIAENAFANCDNLEILYIPESVKKADGDFLSGCTSLETVASENTELFAENNFGISDTAEILTAGNKFGKFLWDNGVLYGSNEDKTWTLLNVPTDFNTTLTTPAGTSVIYKEAMKGCQDFKYLHIQDDLALREIGEGAFQNCTTLEKFDLAVCTNLTTIGNRAFYGCSRLVQIFLPESLKTIGDQAFYRCTAMEEISASGVCEIGDQAFYECGSLMTADLFDSTEILGDGTFYGCIGLLEVTLPETLSSMGEGCFENCTMLKKVTLNGTITGISRYCFYGCRNLSDVTLPDTMTKTAALRVIGVRAFGLCNSLESLDLSEQKSLTAMGEGTFEGCTELTTVKLPESLTKIPDYCFQGCDSLSILQMDTDQVIPPGEKIFGEKDELPSFLHIWVKEGMTDAYQNVYTPVLDPVYGEGTTADILGVINNKQEIIKGILFEITDEGRVLKKASTDLSGEYMLPDGIVRIEDDAFEGCDKLTDFYLMGDYSVALGNRCFKGCTGLKTVKLLGSVTEWGEETFMNCTGLEKVILGDSEQGIIESVGDRAFKGCTGLSSAVSVELRAAIKYYGEECFADCSNITGIGMTERARISMTSIGAGAFRNCTSLTALLTSKLTGLTYIGDYAFANCDTLKQPAVPANVTYVGEGCFMDCDNIQYVSFYCGLEEYPKDCFKNCIKLIRTGGTAAAFNGLKRIGESAYEGCSSLTVSSSWNLGRYANLEEIGDRAFYGCATLTDSVLSTKMTSIGASAFEGCSSLHTLWIQTEAAPLFGVFFLENMPEDFCIRVPDSQDHADSIYKDYLEKMTAVLGQKNAYQILDSFSDGAKDRQPELASEEEQETEEQEDIATDETQENTEKENTPGEIEDVSENVDAEVTVTPAPEDTADTSQDTTEDSETQTDQDSEIPEQSGQDSTASDQTGQDSENSEKTAEEADTVQQPDSGEITEDRE